MLELITLNNIDTVKLIKDVVIRPLKINKDETGILVETLRTDWVDLYGSDRQFAMQYYSITDPGIARDEDLWHYHPSLQDDRFLVANGSVVVAVADNRIDSETKGLLNLFHMVSNENPFELLIPRKTLHGFMVTSETPATLLNFPTKLYNPTEEGRIPYEEALVKTPTGELFQWNLVREFFASVKY